MWEENQQLNMWNRSFESIKKMGKETKQEHTCVNGSKNKKIKLRFLGKFMRMHELPCVRVIKPTCVGKIIHT